MAISYSIDRNTINELRRERVAPLYQLDIYNDPDMVNKLVNIIWSNIMPIYNHNRIAHRKNSHKEMRSMIRGALDQLVIVTPYFNYEIEVYHKRSKYSRRKRKKFFYGEFEPMYRFNLYGHFKPEDLGQFTTEDIINYER